MSFLAFHIAPLVDPTENNGLRSTVADVNSLIFKIIVELSCSRSGCVGVFLIIDRIEGGPVSRSLDQINSI